MITTLYCKNDNGDLSALRNIRIPDICFDILRENGKCIFSYTEPLRSILHHSVGPEVFTETREAFHVQLNKVVNHNFYEVVGCACDDDGKFLEHVKAGWFN